MHRGEVSNDQCVNACCKAAQSSNRQGKACVSGVRSVCVAADLEHPLISMLTSCYDRVFLEILLLAVCSVAFS